MGKSYYRLPAINPEYIDKLDYFLLFESNLQDKENFHSHIFMNPIDIIKVSHYQDIEGAFKKIDDYAREHYLAGYFSYELGYFFETNSFPRKPKVNKPLIHLCVFDKAASFDHRFLKPSYNLSGLFINCPQNKSFSLKNLKFNLKHSVYIKKINRIKGYIRRGQTYQVNFTGKYYFDFYGNAVSFYQELKNKQSVPYSAFLKLRDEYVISLSPELFFKREGLKIYSQPMKGTIRRGKNIKEDKEAILRLKESLKDRAENLMIVDLMRNDLGRISKFNSIKVSSLFNIEKYNTLFQMTSNVSSTLRAGITYLDIFKNIFPGGSVTGAPKIRTMQIIRGLEEAQRNIYCGALGIIFPGNRAVFNMPIRTISISKKRGEMGIGSGIVIDSEAKKEFQECVLKARFLTDKYRPFDLIETILWNKKYIFLNEHLKRLGDSAQYFGFSFDKSQLISELGKLAKDFKNNLRYRVRLLLGKKDFPKIEYSLLKADNNAVKYFAISRYRTNPEDVFLYHKTTNRDLYDSEYKFYCLKGYFDVVFLNKKNQITEGAISNIIIEINNSLYTPPLESGLLPGIFRQKLLKGKKIKEKTIFFKDLRNADKIFLSNSVRGLTEVKLK